MKTIIYEENIKGIRQFGFYQDKGNVVFQYISSEESPNKNIFKSSFSEKNFKLFDQ